MHSVHVERFNLEKLNEVEDKEQQRVEITNKLAAYENLDTEVDINNAWETIRESIKISAKASLGVVPQWGSITVLTPYGIPVDISYPYSEVILA
jgi:hypothetical protein